MTTNCLRSCGHDFFFEQRPAATFDEIQLRVDLIGAVNGDIDHPGIVGFDEWNAGLSCEGGGVVEVGTA